MQLMRPQEVVVGNPEGEIVVGTIIVVKAVCRTIRGLVGTVEPLDHLLVRTKLRGDCIIVRKADDLGDLELELLTELMEKLLGGKRIGTIAVSDKAEVFG